MDQSTDIRATFFLECEELVESLNEGLAEIEEALERGAVEPETVNAVFRAVHSIKGGAGAFKIEALVRFAHHFETTLDALRSRRLIPDPPLILLFHRAADHLSDLLAAARDGSDPDAAGSTELIAQLVASIGREHEEDTSDADADDFGFIPLGVSLDLDLPEAGDRRYQIAFSPRRALYLNGHDPSILFRLLEDLGAITVRVDRRRLPAFDTMDWQDSYLDWAVSLTTAEPEHQIDEVFEFVEGLCALEITVTPPALPPAEAEPADDEPPPIQPVSLGRPVDGSEDKKGTAPRATVRVDLDRVDRLINVVGELVINQAMLSQCVQDAGVPARSPVRAGLDDFRNLAREIQESVMSIRAQAIKPLFQRMARIAREACDIAGKQVRLATEGEGTEVDKTVIERLADPLTHMIRNAVDHGIEAPEVRRAAGKPETGCIMLSAAHRSGRVMIEVSDDGGGINRPRVRQIAASKGLIAEDADLSEADIDMLLFLPGFSTSSTVSDLSGRGVGMDVVKSAIQALGGRVSIASVQGKGTTFSISLPLTLAVLDGMVVDVAGQTMVVPITAIVETLRPLPQDVHCLGSGGQVVAIRNAFVPIVDLGAVFGHRAAARDFSERVLLLVENEQQTQCALVVDTIHDQRQVVIKGMDSGYGRIPGIAAATILGDGRIALIIDPDEALRLSSEAS